MGIKTSSDGKNGKEPIDLQKEITSANRNTKPKKTRRRRKGKSPAPIQTLFNTCKELFANGGFGSVPKPDDVHRLCSILDNLKAADVDLSPELLYFRSKETEGSPTITYLHLHLCEKFSIGIFCLPPSGVLPLHNHPGMTVFSKLLFGTMHIKSYDWEAGVSQNATRKTRLAKLKVNREFKAPCNTSVLYPTDGGNMHCFTAVTPCAVLDVLVPPYSDPDCTYYREFPFHHFSVEGVTVSEGDEGNYAWLEERERPDDLVVEGGIYTGPEIIKT